MSAVRVAVRRFPAFESAIGKQWDAFEAVAHTGLTLELAPLDLHRCTRRSSTPPSRGTLSS
jgi:hypothetical protein